MFEAKEKDIMKHFKLLNKDGDTIIIVHAKTRAEAEAYAREKLPPGVVAKIVDLGVEEAMSEAGIIELREGRERMKKWRLVDRKGQTIKVVEAEHKSEADLIGLKTFPGKYSRCEDLGVVEAVSEGELVKLRESFKAGFMREGKPESVAEKMADIAVQGREGMGDRRE